MKKLEKPVLAEGEVTGHAHRIDAPIDVFEAADGTRIFENSSPVTVRHEEHGAVEIPAGEHISGIVVEYDHFAEEAKNVQD
jgi:hypothetical protein